MLQIYVDVTKEILTGLRNNQDSKSSKCKIFSHHKWMSVLVDNPDNLPGATSRKRKCQWLGIIVDS